MNRRKQRPNFLWISFEDTNPFYRCYGDKIARTPNLDQLASEGCIWVNAFSTSGVCAPARSAVITGMYPISIGTHHMRTSHTNQYCPELPTPYSAVPPHYVKCFTEYLRAEGYYCTNNEKTDYQFASPLTAWDELGPNAHWRNRTDSKQPFFAVFNLENTHESHMWEEKCPEISFDPAKIKVPPYFPDTLEVRKALARMYTNIETNDKKLGELLRQLEEDGLAENTVVFHWSDHGPLPRGKRWPYDSGIHVPLIIRCPEHLKPGSVSRRLVSTIDLGPTVLSIAEIPIPSYIQGKAFLGSQAEPPRRYVYASRDRHDTAYDMVRAVRDKRFKYIRNYYPEKPYLWGWIPYMNKHPIMQEMWRCYAEGKLKGPQLLLFQSKRPTEELYDTKRDPWEINNLAMNPRYTKELKRMRKALDEWLKEVCDMGRIAEVEMLHLWRPGGQKPDIAVPLFIPFTPKNPGLEPVYGEFCAEGMVVLTIHCTTQGSSIAYRYDSDPPNRWRLYTQPLHLTKGIYTITAVGVRIGYKNSALATIKITVT